MIVPPQPAVTSQGTTVHRSPIWNSRGFTGAGVKVGVIDVGFTGFSGLMGSELPATVVARCYTSVGIFTSDLADCQNTEVHCTAVAEAVVDIAPEVTLYIAKPLSQGDLQATASWMVSQGVTVINHSVGWAWDGPGDGTSPFSASPVNTVDLAVAGGVTWVNAAGNAAERSWFGAYSDVDSDGWLEFTSGGELNRVQLSVGQRLTVQARWDDNWGNAATDLDLYLYNSSVTSVLASSLDEQSGAGGQDPIERIISFTAPVTGAYHLAIKHFAGAAPSWLQLNTFGGPSLDIAASTSSVANPAESANPGMLAVGAANWSTPNTIESFSSRGPTTDGRIKPDIVGADAGDSVSYSGAFFGTSQASLHVAGLAALVLQQFPGFTPTQVADYLKVAASPRGAVPNNTWGYGLAQLPSLVPGAPTSIGATPSDRAAEVSWSAPAADGGSPIAQYTVTSDPEGHTATADGSTLSNTVTGLTNGTSYTFSVTATNAVGTSTPSETSNSVTPAAVPDPPTNVAATAGRGEATVTWQAPASDGGNAITGYAVTSNPGDVTATSTGASLTAVVTPLSIGTTYTFTVTATNVMGASAASDPSNAIVPLSTPPLVEAASDKTVNEGDALSLQLATFTDVETSETHTATIDWGDGTTASGAATESQGSGSVSGTHTYADNGVRAVTVTVSDGAGGEGSDTLTITVNNVAPTVDAGSDLSGLGTSPTAASQARFTDPGTLDTHTASIDWGDGNVTQASVSMALGIISGHHTYQAAGVYTIQVTVTDDDGGSGSDTIVAEVLSAPAPIAIPSATAWGLIVLATILTAGLAAKLRTVAHSRYS